MYKTFFVIILIIPFVYILMKGRIESILSGGDVSFFIRIASLPLIFKSISEQYFLSGVGIGGIEIIENAVIDSYIKSGFGKMLTLASNANRIANYFFTSFIYFGIIAGSFFYYMIFKLLKINSLNNKFFFYFMFITYSFFEGGLVTARVWIFIFIILFILSNDLRGRTLKV